MVIGEKLIRVVGRREAAQALGRECVEVSPDGPPFSKKAMPRSREIEASPRGTVTLEQGLRLTQLHSDQVEIQVLRLVSRFGF